MRRLLMALAALPLLGGCVDRGDCLASHEERVPMMMLPIQTPVYGPNGSVSFTTTYTYVPEHDETVCDRWEFPDGRPTAASTPHQSADVAGIVGQM